MFYAGIGSRVTPEHILKQMKKLAIRFSDLGYTLRSGGASGADAAFESGARESAVGDMEIYLPWRTFGTAKDGIKYGHRLSTMSKLKDAVDLMVGMNIHPKAKEYQQNLDIPAASLHGRNMMQVLGENLDTPVDFVVFYAVEECGIVKGGTATAVKLARKLDIPTFNLFHEDGLYKLESFLLTRNLFGF